MSATLFTLALAFTQLPALPVRTDAAAVHARAEVERSAREFRRAVYENFRTDREEFDRRWTAGEVLHRRWTELRQPAIHGAAVAGWYEDAARATLAGQNALPALPYLPVPASLRDDRRSETILPPAPVPLSAPANDTVEEDNPYLPVLPDEDDAPPPPPDAETEGKLPSQIRSLLNLGGFGQ